MKRINACFGFILIGLAYSSLCGAQPSSVVAAANSNQNVALVGGRLIDGFGHQPIANSVILVADGVIQAVGTVNTLAVPSNYTVISTEGHDVLPGLWENHAHLMLTGHADYEHWRKHYTERLASEIMPASAVQLLLAGITSVRDLGAPLNDSLQVRQLIREGKIPGPNLYISGPFIQKEPYPGTDHYRWGVDGPEDARSKVNQLADAGVDFIKLVDQDSMTEAEAEALLNRRMPVGSKLLAIVTARTKFAAA